MSYITLRAKRKKHGLSSENRGVLAYSRMKTCRSMVGAEPVLAMLYKLWPVACVARIERDVKMPAPSHAGSSVDAAEVPIGPERPYSGHHF